MSDRKPGDYVVNSELTQQQIERFVADCVAAGAKDYGDSGTLYCTAWNPKRTEFVEAFGFRFGDTPKSGCARDCTHEYKDNAMKQPELMRQIADAMERDPEGWFREFEFLANNGAWCQMMSASEVSQQSQKTTVRPKPRTYTLHVEGMPEGKCGHSDLYRNASDGYTLALTADYPDEQTAREALEKLTEAMGNKGATWD